MMPILSRRILNRTGRLSTAAALVALLATPGVTQQGAAPIARYTIDASTTSGIAAMGGGMGAGLSMVFGGGGNKMIHTLDLRLGSTRAATPGAPKADHFMPVGAKLGKSVPLYTPTPGTATPREDGKQMPKDFQKPKGRLLIFWGCGPKAPKGQPVVIDFAKVAAGQMPPGLFTSGVNIPADWAISLANSKTYGEWPNGKDRKTVSADSSLIGEHRIAGNYSPEIKFSLAQDFLPAITGKASDMAGGATMLNWNSVANATGYYAWTMGFNPGPDGQANDMVWWSSSTTQNFGGALWDWIAPATVNRLIAQKVVLPPSQTSCIMPAEVKQAASQFMMGNLYAYGPEANFAYPPRPDNPKAAWKPEWTARVRYRSNSMWFINGPHMGGMMRGEDSSTAGQSEKPKKKCRGGLGGMLAGAAGVGC